MTERYPLGRLMFRVEGEFWNAYFGTGPEDALLLGSIRMSLVTQSLVAKLQFMQMFSDAVARGIEDITGESPTMTTEAAPENERSGRA
jgi:hypothetical protein